MTDDDPTSDDDLALTQMRSVWLSMREDDAEPSDRGMAALLAAAREKAEEMKPRPSWWARFVDQLRRPPVLALATVVVLVGGAVVLSTQRNKDEAARNEVVSETASPATVAPADRAPEPPAATAVEGGYLSNEVEPPADRLGAASQDQPSTAQRPSAVATESKKSEPIARAKKAAPAKAERSVPAPAPPANKPDAAKDYDSSPSPGAASAPLEIAADDMQPKGSSGAAPSTDSKAVTRKPLPTIEGEDRGGETTVATLVKQCELAAAKNDCASVRAIAAKIAKQDPALYKAKVSKNAAVQRCLE